MSLDPRRTQAHPGLRVHEGRGRENDGEGRLLQEDDDRPRDDAVGRLAHEIGTVARHAPERGHFTDGRADEPLGCDERQVGQGLHQVADERDLYHGLARLGLVK